MWIDRQSLPGELLGALEMSYIGIQVTVVVALDM
jgi:hypothetical protein